MRNIRQILTLRYYRFRLRIQEERPYWGLRRKQSSLRFRVTRLSLSLRRLGSAAYSHLKSLIELAYRSVSWAIPGGVLAATFSLLPQLMLSAGVANPIPLQDISDASAAAYDGALVAMLTVTGLFLSLYFTNFNTVIGTLYVDVPENIRNLLINEPVNRIATLLLTNLIVFTSMTLGGAVVFSARPVVSIVLVLIVGVLTVPMFAFVARRTLSFFNPSYLVRSIIAKLEAASRDAASTRFAALDVSIQDYRMRVAHAEAQKLRSLGRLVVEKPNLRHDSLSQLTVISLGFLARYVRRKQRIPIDSAWYRKTFRHKYLYLGNLAEVQLALQTYTGVQPEQIPDRDWLESTLMIFLEDVFQRVVNDSDYLVAAEIVRTSHTVFDELGAEHQISIAARSVLALYQSLYPSLISQESTLSRTGRLEQLQLIEDLSFLPVTILLSFFRRSGSLDIKTLTSEVMKIDWRDEKDLYVRGLPTYVLSDLNLLRKRIELELETEGEVVSAPWYVCQLVVNPVAESLKKQLTALIDLGHDYYVKESNKLIDAERHHAAMLLIHRGLEYSHKLDHHSESLFAIMRVIEGYRVLKELPIAEIDARAEIKKIIDLKRKLIINITRCIPNLLDNDLFRNDDTPDMLGQAVKILGEEYFSALRSGDGKLAAPVFRSYFLGVLAARDAIAMATADWQPPENIRFIGEPISDLLALSGYAYLFGEFHQKSSLWNTCTIVWDEFLNDATMYKSMAMTVRLIGMAKRSLTLFVFSHTRNIWMQQFRHILKDLPLLPLDRGSDRMALRRSVRSHPSLCIRTIAPNEHYRSMHYEPEDIFVDMYLAKKLGLETSQWQGLRNLRKDIEHQRELEAEHDFRLDDFVVASDAG